MYRSEDGQLVMSNFYYLYSENDLLVVPLGTQLAGSDLYVNIMAYMYFYSEAIFVDSVC